MTFKFFRQVVFRYPGLLCSQLPSPRPQSSFAAMSTNAGQSGMVTVTISIFFLFFASLTELRQAFLFEFPYYLFSSFIPWVLILNVSCFWKIKQIWRKLPSFGYFCSYTTRVMRLRAFFELSFFYRRPRLICVHSTNTFDHPWIHKLGPLVKTSKFFRLLWRTRQTRKSTRRSSWQTVSGPFWSPTARQCLLRNLIRLKSCTLPPKLWQMFAKFYISFNTYLNVNHLVLILCKRREETWHGIHILY